ncbi:hypothetical protein K523DRAFT_236942 [Schizophyllum commune Tattone D]|nr:hypothetical protein K523DRAFT_236942 [Schizophyllum commune Tattone D]
MSAISANNSDSPATKRKRSDTEDAQDEPPTRSIIWFDDGNIVLQAENVQFRFFKGILAAYSPFFRDAFAVPQPANNSEDTLEGCPVMKLPDIAADVEYMLSFILEPKSSKLLPCIADIVSALRMGHKYLMAALWDDAVDRLRYEFPDKLDEYQERRDGANGARAQRIRLDMDSSERLLNLVDPVQSAGLQRILPALCHRVLEKTKLDVLARGLTKAGRLEDPSMQTRIMLLAALVKRPSLRARIHRRAFAEPYAVSKACFDHHGCHQARLSQISKSLQQIEMDNKFGLFKPWSPDFASAQKINICGWCADKTLENVAAEQQAIWDELPSFFGLPPWAELQDHVLE